MPETATDPKTGEQVEWDGNQWSPMAKQPGLASQTFKTVDDVMRTLASGITLGGADEISALLNSAIGLPGPGGFADPATGYKEHQAAEQKRQEDISLGIQIPGEIAGATAMTVATMGLGAPAAVTRVAAQIPGWAKAAGLGAGLGGLYGFNTGAPGERLKSAVPSAVIGAGMGPLGYAAGRGLEKTGSAIGREVGQRFSAKNTAYQTIREAFAMDEIPLGRALARLRELGPQATLADVGGANVRGLTRGVSGLSGPAKSRIDTILKSRGVKEAERIFKTIDKNLSQAAFYEETDMFLRNMRERAGPLYSAAYERHPSIMSPSLDRWLRQSPKAKAALREARDIVAEQRARGEAKYLGPVDEELLAAVRAARDVGIRPPTEPVMEALPGPVRGFSLETWQLIKEGLERVADGPRYKNQLTGGYNKAGKEIIKSSGWLVKQLDNATGGKDKSLYAKARALYAGNAEGLEAVRHGREAIKVDPEIITRELTKLSETGQQAYRIGFARALKDIADKTSDTAGIARRIWGNPINRKRIQAAFPDKKSSDEFAQVMARELLFRETELGVLAGSRTAPMASEMVGVKKAAGTGAALLAAGAVGGGGGIIVAGIRARVARSIAEGVLGPDNPEYYRVLGRMLISRNQSENQFVFDQLRRMPVPLTEKAGTLARILTVMGGLSAKQVAGEVGLTQLPRGTRGMGLAGPGPQPRPPMPPP